ncbi:MAG: lamin tail domain-containing protein [Acidimicrobiales bacterium]
MVLRYDLPVERMRVRDVRAEGQMTMRSTYTIRRRVPISVGAAILGATTLAPVPAAAAAADVIISELMYHPTDAVAVEFLELHNTGTTTVDLSGWCLTTGVDVCFAPGTVLGANGFLLVTDNLGGFGAAYPGTPTPVAQYEGALSNGGETIDLIDAGANVIDSVSYDDAAPWPISPDGNGPSLEVVDPLAANDSASNWTASVSAAGHTAGAANSQTGVTNPAIDAVTATPARPTNQQSTVISATISDAVSATLTYKVNFGAEKTVTMSDGPGSPGGANDGVWGATIPPAAAGDLVRYRIDAVNAGGALSSPGAADSIMFHGFTVSDGVTSNLPIIEWFMEDSVYEDLLANHRYDDVAGAAVIAYNGRVIDSATMRSIRGNSSRSNLKVN